MVFLKAPSMVQSFLFFWSLPFLTKPKPMVSSLISILMTQTAESLSNYTLKPTTLTNRLLLQTLVTGLVALIDGFLINTSSSTFLSVSSFTPSPLIKTTNLPLYRWKWAPAFFNRPLKSNTLASLLILIFRCPPTFAMFVGPPSFTCGVLAKFGAFLILLLLSALFSLLSSLELTMPVLSSLVFLALCSLSCSA
jgi:hypothetical protein